MHQSKNCVSRAEHGSDWIPDPASRLWARAWFALLPLLLAALFASIANAQTATILGTVTDPTGAAVPGAKVIITNTATGTSRTVTTNQAGNYDAPELNIGTYTVKADMAGFKAYERTGIVLNVNGTLRVDIPLQIGQAQESVTVEA